MSPYPPRQHRVPFWTFKRKLANQTAQAGLAAYFLAHPDYQERFRYSPDDYGNKNTVGKRMKDFLKELAYQRLPVDKLLHPDHRADYRFPNNRLPSVDVLYNGYHGDQK